jgi:hypothetical protein
MPVLQIVLPTDSFDQWRQKDNAAINAQNNAGVNAVIKVVMPLNNQDILVYNSTDGFFENTGISSFITQVIESLASIPGSDLKPYYLTQAMHQIY